MTHGSLFSGIGGAELAAEWMGWDNVFSCEINPFGRKILEYYWPNAIHYEDINNTDFSIWRGRIDILTGGFPCFAAGTMVFVRKRGYVPIEKIKVGWSVLTHKGRFKKVTSTMRKQTSDIYEIKVHGIAEPIKVTGDHPFLTYREKWVPAKELQSAGRNKKASRICFPGDVVYRKDVHSEAFWYIVGRYLGDGWIVNKKKSHKQRNHSITTICCSHEEIDELKLRVSAAGYDYNVYKQRTVFKININNKDLVNFLKPFGKYAHGKKLAPVCYALSKEKKLSLINGWVDSDGYINNGVRYGVTVSRQLAYGMARIWRSAMCKPVGIAKIKTPKQCIIEGRTVNQRDYYRVTFSTSEKYSICEDNKVWCGVKSVIKTNESITVYNISVDEDESYTADGVAVHNCQPFSLAGNRKGTDDPRHLWPRMLEVIKDVQPTWIVGENVSGIVSWDGGLVFEQVCLDLEAAGYEVQPVILPAVAVNAPHRRDRVWFVARRNVAYPNSIGGSTGHKEVSGKNEKIPQRNKNTKLGDTDSRITPNPNSERQQGEGELTVRGREEQSKWSLPTNNTPNTERGVCKGELKQGQRQGESGGCNSRVAPDTSDKGLQGSKDRGGSECCGEKQNKQSSRCVQPGWDNFPTQSPVRSIYDGVPSTMVRNIKAEIYGQISERYTDKDLQEVWQAFQSEEVREQIGRLYKIHEPGVLLQTVQLCSPSNTDEKGISVFSEETSKEILRKMRKHGQLANTPQGRKLEKQFKKQFGDSLPHLSHEIALVTMEAERASRKHLAWHRNESIKGYGNAWVPQVAYEIYKIIVLCCRTHEKT